MADVVDPATRSRMMSGIRGKNTKPELTVRRALHAAGFRFRLHAKDLPGKPDIVLPKYNAVILVHGCFWHGHDGCPAANTPANRAGFWEEKLSKNVERDRRHALMLRSSDWRIATVWECYVRRTDPEEIGKKLGTWLTSKEEKLELPSH